MKITTVEGVLTSLFPESRLRAEARALGVEKRRRKVDVVALFWTLVLGFGVGKLRSLAELRRAYENRTGTGIEESSLYERFTPRLAKLLRGMVGEVLGRGLLCARRNQSQQARPGVPAPGNAGSAA